MKNDIAHITKEALDEWFNDYLYPYQLALLRAERQPKREIIGKQQIGLTSFFAWEAFNDAILTGANQIFYCENQHQANYCLEIIQRFAENFGVTLIAYKSIYCSIVNLSNGAILYFLNPTSKTLAGIAGNVYACDFLYWKDFDRINKYVSSFAAKKIYRKTYFATLNTENADLLLINGRLA